MRFAVAVLAVFLLVSCGGGGAEESAPRISPASGGDPVPQGMTYQEFRRHEIGQGDLLAAQKRFLMLDRNHNGLLSDQELAGGD